MKETIQILKALADETRLRIVNILSVKEFCVCEIQEILSMSEPRISRHLRILKTAGLVSSKEEGRWVFYTLQPDPKLERLFSFLKGSLKDNEVFKRDLEKAMKTNLACRVNY